MSDNVDSWTTIIIKEIGNISPFSPTSALDQNEGDVAQMVIHNFLTTQSDCPSISVSVGHRKSTIILMRSIAV